MQENNLKYNNTTGITSFHLRSKYNKAIDNPLTIIENTKTSNGLIAYVCRTKPPTLSYFFLKG
jgi:hypothetical protein